MRVVSKPVVKTNYIVELDDEELAVIITAIGNLTPSRVSNTKRFSDPNNLTAFWKELISATT